MIDGEGYKSFDDAEHQLMGMKISYLAEEHVRTNQIDTKADIRKVNELMIEEYRQSLNDQNINFVMGVDQMITTTEIRESKSNTYLMKGMPDIELKTGNHNNAITRGGPSDPDECNVVIPENGFFNALVW